jgi:hypothetical protein
MAHNCVIDGAKLGGQGIRRHFLVALSANDHHLITDVDLTA